MTAHHFTCANVADYLLYRMYNIDIRLTELSSYLHTHEL